MKRNSPGCLLRCCDACVVFEDHFTADVDGDPPRAVMGWNLVDSVGDWKTQAQTLEFNSTGPTWSPDSTLADDWIIEPAGDDWLLTPDLADEDDADRLVGFAGSGGSKLNLSFFLNDVADSFGLLTVGSTQARLAVFISAGDGVTPGAIEFWTRGNLPAPLALALRVESLADDFDAGVWQELEVCIDAGVVDVIVNGVQYARFHYALAEYETCAWYAILAGVCATSFRLDDIIQRKTEGAGCPDCSAFCWLDDCSGGTLKLTLTGFPYGADGEHDAISPAAADANGYRWNETGIPLGGGDYLELDVFTADADGCVLRVEATYTFGDPFHVPASGYVEICQEQKHLVAGFPVTLSYDGKTALIECGTGT